MKNRILGNGLEVSEISLGCMGMTHAFGAPSDKKEMTNLLHKAVDLGYKYFDTAECYTGKDANGVTQYNEELVGPALKSYRDKVVIASKFGVRHSLTGLKMDSNPKTIRKSIESSLKRLDTDYIDLYYQHRIDPKIEPEEVASVMADLIKEGKIRFWGISEANEEYLRRAHTICPVTAIQNRYSMMYRNYDSLFPVLKELNIGYVAFSPLANGVLSDAYSKNDKFRDLQDYRTFMPQFKSKAFKENEELFKMLRKIAAENNATPAQVSLAWMINKHKNLVPIPGTRKLERLEENAGASEIILTDDEVKDIDNQLNAMKMSAVFGGTKSSK